MIVISSEDGEEEGGVEERFVAETFVVRLSKRKR